MYTTLLFASGYLIILIWAFDSIRFFCLIPPIGFIIKHDFRISYSLSFKIRDLDNWKKRSSQKKKFAKQNCKILNYKRSAVCLFRPISNRYPC